MKNPKIIVTDNRREYRYKRTKRLWEGQVWSDYDIYSDPTTKEQDKSCAQIVMLKSRQIG